MNDVFQSDLKVGKVYEKIVLEKIHKKYPKAYIEKGYCKDWDIYIPELEIGVEVKSDKKSMYTGNIVIEIEFDNKPSALSTTKAEWWVIYDGIYYNWFTVTNIKKCIIENNLTYRKFIGRGDTKQKKAYLIKKEMLYKYKEI
tara:strand:- start:369 stop:794 length:426 start_codon:yes stop_codon:yes gene_type:complete